MHMPDDSSSGGIPFSTRVKPAMPTLEQREAAIITRLTEVARMHGLRSLCAEEEMRGIHRGQISFLPTDEGHGVTLVVNGLRSLCAEEEMRGIHRGQISFLPTDEGHGVTLVVKRLNTPSRDETSLHIDTGQLFGILKQAAVSPQLPLKPENRQAHTPPRVMGSSINFSSMEALEHAVHAIDPWARAWTPQGRGGSAAR